ncbi:hypothetical protein E4U41_003610 [Claviceps citrina]|nr:hypothetical protein E4U41_003610 [Claviceps citrina]
MDAPAPQPWGLGLRTRMKAPPPSFVIFFPARDHPAFPIADGTTAQLSVGKAQPNISWNNSLAAPQPFCRLPAWHRVPVEAFPGKNGAESTRIIMKRIFQPDHRFAKKSTLQAECKEVAAAKAAEAVALHWTMLDRLELPGAKSRKLDSFQASDALHKSSGAPLSAAEMAQLYLKAKVDIVNAIMKIPRPLLAKEVEDLRSLKRTRGVTPTKRSIDKNNCIEQDGLYGGYRVQSYDQLLPIILKAMELGNAPIDVLSASIAEISANFAKEGRRNPRHRISLQGIPHLPDIIDRPELKEEVSLFLPSGGSAVDSKSPIKRSPQPNQPYESTPPRRLGDTVVKLVPAASPPVESSPVKSPSSTSSSPFVNTPSRLDNGVSINPLVSPSERTSPVTPGPTLTFKAPSPSSLDSSSLTDLDQSMGLDHSSPCKPFQSESPCNATEVTQSVNPGPTLALQEPSYLDSPSSNLDQSMDLDHLSPGKPLQSETQTKYPNPLSSPSGMVVHGATNSAALANPLQQDNATENNAALGLVASIPAAATPKRVTSAFRPDWPSDMSQIDFGPISPSFDSSNWLNNHATARGKPTLKKASRRQSEPLIRKCLNEQASRRQSMSPNRLLFRDDLAFETPKASTTQAVEVENKSCQNDVKPENGSLIRTPEQATSTESNLEFFTPAISWARMTGRVPSNAVTPLRTLASPLKGVHNVDMRQHLDIFGAPAETPAISTSHNSSAVDTLAEIAQRHCDGQANVRVTEENGRLIVRFKLPTEFAHLFPNHQGEDESRFTTTPSAISSSPRISFAGHQLNDAIVNGQTDKEQPSTPTAVLDEENHTLVMSDFPASPAALVCEGATSSSSSQNHHTPFVSHSGNAASRAESKPATPMGQAESATAENTEGGVSSRTPSPTLNLCFTPVNQSSPRSLSPNVAANHEASEVKIDQGLTQQEQAALEPKLFDDSPGRDYMREFIKRTSRKRLSTTEAGSPVAPPSKRVALGDKSSNTPSPHKKKHTSESDIENIEVDTKLATKPVLKKARRSDELESIESSASTETEPSKVILNTEAAAHTADAAGDQENEADTTTGTRRSTRIRSKKPTTGTASKSSIPTAIKLGSRSGMGRGGLNSTTRTDQQDLVHQTRMNTRKNRGNAEHPSHVLAKYQEERVSDDSSESELGGKLSTGGKNVGWKTPLEAHEDERPKKARMTSTYKRKASGIAKSSKPATAAQKQQRTAQVAATLGMSQNGTPAKPNRVTRSSTRVQRV